MVVFLSIFVADTKITFVYNFVAPLIQSVLLRMTVQDSLPAEKKLFFLSLFRNLKVLYLSW